MIKLDGSVYEGIWESDKENQHGRMKYANGNIYVGDWIDGKLSGHGRFYKADDNSIYDGEWANNVRQGEGTILT